MAPMRSSPAGTLQLSYFPCLAFALAAALLHIASSTRWPAAAAAAMIAKQPGSADARGSMSLHKGFLAAGKLQAPGIERTFRSDEREFIEDDFSQQMDRLRELLHMTRDLIYNRGYAQLPTWTHWILHVTLSWVIFMTLSLLVWIYAYPDDPDLDELFSGREDKDVDPATTFTDSKFGCFQAPKVCLCACFCPALRWADTVNMAGFMRVPVALGLFFVCALLNGLTGTFCYSGFITCFMILFYRHKLRAKLGLASFTCASCCADFFYVFCCSWCAIAQEARVVRYEYQKGTLSLTTGKRYGKLELPDRPFPRPASDRNLTRMDRVLAPPPQPAPLAAQRLVAEGG